MFPPLGFDEGPKVEFTAIILGAGNSLRMGQPKALKFVMGQPAWLRLGQLCIDAGAKKALVMVSADVQAHISENMPLDSANHHGIEPIAVPEKLRHRGPIGSVLHGIRCTSKTEGWLLWPVDHPFVDRDTIKKLTAGTGLVRVPRHEGRRGHPIYIDGSDREQLLDLLESGKTLRDYVHLHSDETKDIEVDDPAIQWNCDSPAAFRTWHAKFEELVKSTGR